MGIEPPLISEFKPKTKKISYAKLTRVRSLVNFQILRPCKHFAAWDMGARERFLPSMHSNMIHQLVLSLKRASIARATHPEACMRCALGSPNMLHRQMCHNLMHRTEYLAARLPILITVRIVIVHVMMMVQMMSAHVLIHPQALHFLFDWRLMSHIAKEGARRARIHRQIQIVMMMDGRREVALMRMRMIGIVVGRWRSGGNAHSHRMLMVCGELIVMDHSRMGVVAVGQGGK